MLSPKDPLTRNKLLHVGVLSSKCSTCIHLTRLPLLATHSSVYLSTLLTHRSTSPRYSLTGLPLLATHSPVYLCSPVYIWHWNPLHCLHLALEPPPLSQGLTSGVLPATTHPAGSTKGLTSGVLPATTHPAVSTKGLTSGVLLSMTHPAGSTKGLTIGVLLATTHPADSTKGLTSGL